MTFIAVLSIRIVSFVFLPCRTQCRSASSTERAPLCGVTRCTVHFNTVRVSLYRALQTPVNNIALYASSLVTTLRCWAQSPGVATRVGYVVSSVVPRRIGPLNRPMPCASGLCAHARLHTPITDIDIGSQLHTPRVTAIRILSLCRECITRIRLKSGWSPQHYNELCMP